MTNRVRSVTLLQATQESPMLSKLSSLVSESSARLKAIEALIPANLRASVKPGPIDGATWCLILDNNASAAKIRQLLPALQSHLRTKGWEVNSIRVKVQISQPI
jgi:hypothetical protein